MSRNIIAIIAILFCTTVAWTILGTTVFLRTGASGNSLASSVASTWGGPQQQNPPSVTAVRTEEQQVEEREGNLVRTHPVTRELRTPLTIEQSRVDVRLDLEQRQKGLLWFPTYRVSFDADYRLHHDAKGGAVTMTLPFPAVGAIYDDLTLKINGQSVPFQTGDRSLTARMDLPAGSPIRIHAAYRSQGMREWSYGFGDGIGQVHDFELRMKTDFDAIDFPDDSLSPSEKTKNADGWMLTWRSSNLVTGSNIAMIMPEKLQPGPLAGRISYFAPVSLLFFFFLIFIITTLRGIDLHPMHYFFLATAFFAFHLLFAYLVDHVSIHLAFGISSLVSIFLVVSYLRVVVNARFAWVEAALSQMVYLVLFSYAFFFPGFTGLAITIVAIVTLFLVMQMTARLDWRTRAMRPQAK